MNITLLDWVGSSGRMDDQFADTGRVDLAHQPGLALHSIALEHQRGRG